MVLSQFPQPGAEQKQVIDFSAKTAIRKLFNSIFLHNLFLLKILAIKKSDSNMIFSLSIKNSFKELVSINLISFAFLINQQRVGAKSISIKLVNSCFLIASIYSDISLLNSAEQMSF
jgi:hypothetical protein